MIKLIVADLDGTLVNSDVPDYQISKELIDSIKELTNRGIYFTIATGRPHISAQPIVDQLGLKCPYIAYNGAQIIGICGEKIYEKYLDLSCWIEEFRTIDAMGAHVLVYSDSQAFCLRHSDRIKKYERKEKIQCETISLDQILNIKSSKILFLGDVEKIRNTISQNDFLMEHHKLMQSEEDYLEIVQSELNKGDTLCKLIELLDIQDKVLSIGNHLNDLELLEKAHIGVAVVNATNQLKEIADYITEEAYDKGVIEVINRFIFNKVKNNKVVE